MAPRLQAQLSARGCSWPTIASRFKAVVEVGLSGRSVEGSSHIEAERAIMDGQWKGASWCAKRMVTDYQWKAETLEGALASTPSSRILWIPGEQHDIRVRRLPTGKTAYT